MNHSTCLYLNFHRLAAHPLPQQPPRRHPERSEESISTSPKHAN